MMIDRRTVTAGLLGTAGLAAVSPLAHAAVPRDARAIAKEAYLYAFAMLENYQTWYKQAVDAKSPEYIGGFGKYRHYSEPFTPANHDVVTPNNDTPYSWAWLDLRAEPLCSACRRCRRTAITWSNGSISLRRTLPMSGFDRPASAPAAISLLARSGTAASPLASGKSSRPKRKSSAR